MLQDPLQKQKHGVSDSTSVPNPPPPPPQKKEEISVLGNSKIPTQHLICFWALGVEHVISGATMRRF